MKRLYAIILLIVLILMQVTTVNARDVGTEFDARDEGVIRGLEKQKSSGKSSKSSKSSSTELKGTGTGGSSDLNLDALGKEINNVSASSEATTAINKVLGVVTVLIVTAAIILLIMKGVAFMQAAPEGKAEIKKQLIAIVAGGVIIFGINTIIQTIITVSTNIIK